MLYYSNLMLVKYQRLQTALVHKSLFKFMRLQLEAWKELLFKDHLDYFEQVII